MSEITMREFSVRQPNFPKEMPTDKVYLGYANSLLQAWEKGDVLKDVPESVIKRMCLCLVGYMQDIISDAGIWRTFINQMRSMYNRTLPFYSIGEGYVDYELNPEDVRFLTWYSLAMTYEDMHLISPDDDRIESMAANWYNYLESIYEEAPVPDDYNIGYGLEFHDPEDHEKIYHLGNWLFLNCYLMTPAFAQTLQEILDEPEVAQTDDVTVLHNRLDKAFTEDPTGPLAYYIPEWVHLILTDKLPKEPRRKEEPAEHPYYTKFTAATGGQTVKYFDTYESLNNFFIEALGWTPGEEHLPLMKESGWFALMVNKEKGMLCARDVARQIADPLNPYYSEEVAKDTAIELLTVRGRCPADLLMYAVSNGYLPEAHFPGSADTSLVKDNSDFIARCYLQKYYRGD